MKRFLLAAAALCSFSCSQAGDQTTGPSPTSTSAPASDHPVIARVNGEAVHEDVIDYFRIARFRDAELTAEQRQSIVDDVTQLYALAAAAKAQGLDVENQVALKINLQEKGMLAQLLVKKHTDENPISDDDLRAVYESGVGGDQYRARHILVDNEQRARELIADLDGGADFAKLAEDNSTGPSAKDGGSLGDWFPATQMVKPFADALPLIKPGTYSSDPVKTRFGFHVILVEESRQQPFEEARTQIMENLRKEQVEKYIASVKDGAQIELIP